MRKFTTTICCLAFMISGIMLAISNNEKLETARTISAATIPQLYVVDKAELPLDFQLSQNSTKEEVKDTLKEVTDTVKPLPTPKKVKSVSRRRPKNVEPDTIATQPRSDTIYVSNPVVIIHRCPICNNDSVSTCADE